MSYSNPHTCTYRFPAATLSSAATVGRLIGPSGKSGRLVDMAVVTTTATTDAATALSIGTEADTDAYGVLTIPVTAINLGVNGVSTAAATTATLPADTVVAIATDGGCTAGAGDILVTIDWY